MTIKFSASRYGLQKQCLGKYHFNYIEKLPVTKTTWPATVMGSSIHSYIENYLGLLSNENDIKKLPPLSVTYASQKKNVLDSGEKIGKPRGYSEESFLSEHDLWVKDIMRFLFLYLPNGKRVFEEEINFEIGDVTVNGFIDLQVIDDQNYIFDFKTTKNPQKYFFIDWERDIQSLLYMVAKRAHSFSYLVFDKENKLILTQSRGGYHLDQESGLKQMTQEFVSLHHQSADSKLWSPSPEGCKWCEYKKNCKVAK